MSTLQILPWIDSDYGKKIDAYNFILMNLNKNEISQTRFQETSMNLWELMLGQVERQVVHYAQNRLIPIHFSLPFAIGVILIWWTYACRPHYVHAPRFLNLRLNLSITVNEMSVCLNFLIRFLFSVFIVHFATWLNYVY